MAKKKAKTKTAKPVSTTLATNNEIVKPVLDLSTFKICRLCETRDGPFVDIFNADKVTEKRIKDLMPFMVVENDELPQKICFRCSAKVEELHEFVQRCVKTQENLHQMCNKQLPLVSKTNPILEWEEKLKENNMSNDDICNALIKIAIDGFKDLPLQELPKDISTLIKPNLEKDDYDDIPLKQIKSNTETQEVEVTQRITRSTKNKNESDDSPKQLPSKIKPKKRIREDSCEIVEPEKSITVFKTDTLGNMLSNDLFGSEDTSTHKPKPPEIKGKPFNIMDHVSTIKVNGVGVLFQCKLCNRNFLKKQVVRTHGCAKNGVPKEDFSSIVPPAPEPPKPTVIKYINTKTDKIESDVKKLQPQEAPQKPKPRIGPASKVRKQTSDMPVVGMQVVPQEYIPPTQPLPMPTTQTTGSSTVQIPWGSTIQMPGLGNSQQRYKLMPGPNNTFTIVEDSSKAIEVTTNILHLSVNSSITNKSDPPSTSTHKTIEPNITITQKVNTSSAIIDLDKDESDIETTKVQPPYPVGLFKTSLTPPAINPMTFPTPAMKKQAYTIVQTGNPSKLLISTKTAPTETPEPIEKKLKKSKEAMSGKDEKQAPYAVTLEDTDRPKDPAFFSFVNVDPLLQPSYVLPTASILQETQISTSTHNLKKNTDDMYQCSICKKEFSREKKLLAHINSHFTTSDTEDTEKEEKKESKKRSRK